MLDNNHPDYVVVFLGDLGHLSSTEQRYWRSFNVPPDGAMSEVAIRRSVLGQWADADEPALAVKAAYSRFRQDWRATTGWDLFKPLGPDDEHHLHGLQSLPDRTRRSSTSRSWLSPSCWSSA
jgi:hypothetical protein